MTSSPDQRQGSIKARAALVATAFAAVLAVPARAMAADPVVSVWYRGNPAGTPQQNDLGKIRALGFNGVTWPRGNGAAVPEVQRLAGLVGLKVIVADAPVAATELTTRQPADRVDILVTPTSTTLPTALAWRAVGHGARAIAFDGGARTGAGLEDAKGALKPWARQAIAIARELTANANLASIMKPGPAVIVTPPRAPALDVVMLDADRSWVVVATNTSSARIAAEVRLPAGTPYALWVSWLEQQPLAMISDPAGPRWPLSIEARSARVYIIDKKMR